MAGQEYMKRRRGRGRGYPFAVAPSERTMAQPSAAIWRSTLRQRWFGSRARAGCGPRPRRSWMTVTASLSWRSRRSISNSLGCSRATVATARHVRSGTARASLTCVVTPRAALRRAGRRVAGQGDAVHDAAVPGVIVDGVVLGAAIVPERERARAPAEAAGELRTDLM